MNTTKTKRVRPTVAEREAKLVDALKAGVVAFSYKKKDGELRRAIGTKNLDFIPVEYHPKNTGGSAKAQSNAITYFDMQKLQWRSVATHKAMSVFVK